LPDLLALTDKLSTAERRQISERADLAADYGLLWRQMLDCHHLSEADLLDRLGWKGQKRRLETARDYLFRFIIRILGNTLAQQTPKGEVAEWVDEIEFLFSKGMFPQSLKVIRRAKEACIHQELYELLFRVLTTEQQLLSLTLDLSKLEPLFNENHQSQVSCIAALAEIQRYRSIYSKLNGKAQYLSPLEQNNEILFTPDVAQAFEPTVAPPPTTHTGRFYAVMAQTVYHLHTLKYLEAFEGARQAMNCQEDMPSLWNNEPERLFDAIRLWLKAAYYTDRFEQMIGFIRTSEAYHTNRRLPPPCWHHSSGYSFCSWSNHAM